MPPPTPVCDATKLELSSCFKSVSEQVQQGVVARGGGSQVPTADGGHVANRCKLVAVSKTHPHTILQAVYDAGCRVFGENYTHELCEKAPLLPRDIRWHFVGHLQSNKVKELLTAAPNLDTLESLDTEKLAKKLNDGVAAHWGTKDENILNVFIQVNTSGEESKSGLPPGAAVIKLAEYVATQCPRLRLRGLMTIGMPDYTSRPENFECLTACRKEVAAALQALYNNKQEGSTTTNNIHASYNAVDLDETSLELSMGMSGDFMNAIVMGATNVRVGTAIFGKRSYDVMKLKGGPSGNTGDSGDETTKSNENSTK